MILDTCRLCAIGYKTPASCSEDWGSCDRSLSASVVLSSHSALSITLLLLCTMLEVDKCRLSSQLSGVLWNYQPWLKLDQEIIIHPQIEFLSFIDSLRLINLLAFPKCFQTTDKLPRYLCILQTFCPNHGLESVFPSILIFADFQANA